jgi:hypothetical protein
MKEGRAAGFAPFFVAECWRVLCSPFPLEGGRVWDGGAERNMADGAHEARAPSPAAYRTGVASTPTQPSPLEGEGFAILID